MMPHVEPESAPEASFLREPPAGRRRSPVVQALRPAGRTALLVELVSPEQVWPFYRAVLTRRAEPPLASVADVVPGAQSVLFDGASDLRALAAWVLRVEVGDEPPRTDSDVVRLPVRYDGADLAAVAEVWGTTPEGVVELHAGTLHQVAFLGFAPGFAYLRGVPEGSPVPRLASPRPRVPAGSVAVAGVFTGIYPRATPGGWRLLGRTDAWLFDPERVPPARLAPGALVRFEPVVS
jgi:KipI family sensor histidine kinase inhibitor